MLLHVCQKGGKKKENKGAVDDRGFVLISFVVLRNYIPGEVYDLSLSITADCQGMQVNRFLKEYCR